VEKALEEFRKMAVPTPRRANPAATTAVRGSILIIDDDRDVADGTAEVLREAGYSVAIALTARAALTTARNFDAEVALVDMKLGRNSNGLDLIGTLQHLRPGLVPVVVTAYRSEQAVLAAQRSGAWDFLAKPFYPQELLALLDRCFAGPGSRQTTAETQRAIRAA
jgi:two-component system response regulator HydG